MPDEDIISTIWINIQQSLQTQPYSIKAHNEMNRTMLESVMDMVIDPQLGLQTVADINDAQGVLEFVSYKLFFARYNCNEYCVLVTL